MDFNSLLEYVPSLREWTCTGEIGYGGIGTMSSTVYRLEREMLYKDRRVVDKKLSALKIVEFGSVCPDTERLNKVFERIKDVPHAVNIEDWSRTPIKVVSGDTESYYMYIRMELLEPLPDNGLDEDEVLRLAYEMGRLLSELHDRRVNGERLYHCDIKPFNIMYSTDGSYSFKLCDFDDARTVRESRIPLSDVGTPGFRAPELIDDKHFDNRSDLYSLGVTMYTLLNGGKPPFFDGSIESTVRGEVKGARFPKIKGVSSDVMRLIRRLCRRNPAKRFDSAGEFLEALGPVMNKHNRAAAKKSASLPDDTGTAAMTGDTPDVSGPHDIAQNIRDIADNKFDVADGHSKSAVPSDVPRRPAGSSVDVMAGTLTAYDKRRREADVMADTVSIHEKTARAQTEGTGSEKPKLPREIPSDTERRTLAHATAEINRLLPHPRIYIHHHFWRTTLVWFALIAAAAALIWTLFIPNFAYVDKHFIAVFASSLDLSDMELHDVSGLERCIYLRFLDLRGNPLEPDSIDALQRKLPHCKIIRDVHLGETVLSSDAGRLSASDFVPGDESLLKENLGYFTDLSYIDMSGSTLTREELVALRDSAPENCPVYWTETLDGTDYGLDTETLTLSTFDENTVDALSNFTDLEWVDLSPSPYTDEQLYEFRRAYPEYDIRWTTSFFGKELSTKTTLISLRGVDTSPYNEETELNKLVLFEELESLDLFGTTFNSYAFLEKCRSVRELYLRNSKFSEFSILTSLPELRSLDIGNLRIGNTAFLADLKGLRRLRIDRSVLDRGFEKNLIQLSGLRVLDCSFTGIDLAYLAEMPELKAVRAYDNPAIRLNVTYDTDDRNRMYYRQMENVSTLEVLFANIDANALDKALGNCSDLTVLNICGWKNRTVNLNYLSRNKNLRFLGVCGAECTSPPDHLKNLDVLMVYSITTNCTNRVNTVSPDCRIYDLPMDYYSNFNNYCGYEFMLLLCELYAPDCLEY